jgi:hypothetical protein
MIYVGHSAVWAGLTLQGTISGEMEVDDDPFLLKDSIPMTRLWFT